MIEIRSASEVEALRRSGRVVAEVLSVLMDMVEPGITTGELDRRAEEELRRRGARAAFKGYRGYPAVICASVNDELVHGIPSDERVLKSGDILSIDIGCELNGYYGDTAVTVGVGKISSQTRRLLDVTEEALYAGIEAARPGARLYDISSSIQKVVEDAGFSVVRDYVGHGIGRALHEDPQIPNFGKAGTGPVLEEGMVFALEPMVNAGGPEVKVKRDGWTVVTADGSLCAHFEHTIALANGGAEILTERS